MNSTEQQSTVVKLSLDWLIEQLGRFARREILECYHRDSCIASTRIVIDVLARFGVPASPLPVRAQVFNETFMRLLVQHDRMPRDEDEAQSWVGKGAKCVQIGYGIRASDPERRNRWDGHLVAYLDHQNLFLDAAIDQAARPESNIILPGLLAVKANREFRRGRTPATLCYTAGETQTFIRYEARPRNTTFEASPNWTRDVEERYVAKRIVNLIEAEVVKL